MRRSIGCVAGSVRRRLAARRRFAAHLKCAAKRRAYAGNRRRLGLIVLTVVIVAGGGLVADDDTVSSQEPIVLQPSDDANPPVVELVDGGGDSGDPLSIGDFTLIDQDGEPFSSDELAGHPWVASFIFTKCMGFCPNLVKRLGYEIVDRVDDPEVRFVTITVDPEHDTPERLKRYAEVYDADFDRWTFLTGDQETIYQLIQRGFRLGVTEMQGADRRPGYEVAHSLSLMHVGPDGRIIGKYDSRDDNELVSLRKVLNGQIETPEENRVVASSAEQPVVETDRELVSSTEVAGERSDEQRPLPAWAARLPTTNAMLNGLAMVLLLMGLAAIKLGQVSLHKRLMLTAFGTSIAFLACYLTYHFALNHYTGTHGKSFEGTGTARSVYLTILISHALLAMAVPVLAIITISRGLRGQWDAHRRIARVTFPIWLYVSVTGVIIYGMLYHWPVG